MDLLKNFDYRIKYHPRRKNVVANALSRKSTEVLAHLMVSDWCLREAMQRLCIQEGDNGRYVASLRAQPILVQKIRDGQLVDTEMQRI